MLETVLSEFTEVFDGRLGELKGHRVHIQLKPDARPRFIKARPVPYAIRDEIGRELDRLVEQGVYQPISHSDWATPIVPITKSDGSIRIRNRQSTRQLFAITTLFQRLKICWQR